MCKALGLEVVNAEVRLAAMLGDVLIWALAAWVAFPYARLVWLLCRTAGVSIVRFPVTV